MKEIIPGLWIGDLNAALDSEQLRANNIGSVLSALRGHVKVDSTFTRHQVEVDDDDDSDILSHFPFCVSWIETQLGQRQDVLVHCQAGYSRSPTLVAAYIMYITNVDVASALDIIQAAEPVICPNRGFLAQLGIFYKASCRVSHHDKSTRMFYLERAVREVTNGEGNHMDFIMFPEHHKGPFNTAPNMLKTEMRKLFCRICRRELATQDHIQHFKSLMYPSLAGVKAANVRPVDGDGEGEFSRNIPDTLLSSIKPIAHDQTGTHTISNAAETGDTVAQLPLPRTPAKRSLLSTEYINRREESDITFPDFSTDLGSSAWKPHEENVQNATQVPSTWSRKKKERDIRPSEGANAIRVLHSEVPSGSGFLPTTPVKESAPSINQQQSECSGYFLEPMKWMEPFLGGGTVAGKIRCPNAKCSAKIGNYDWAGMMCSCREWITPAFCIARSKVDESMPSQTNS